MIALFQMMYYYKGRTNRQLITLKIIKIQRDSTGNSL